LKFKRGVASTKGTRGNVLGKRGEKKGATPLKKCRGRGTFTTSRMAGEKRTKEGKGGGGIRSARTGNGW